MAMNGTKQHRVPTIVPPRTIDVHKFAESRAPELETLHSIVANRLDNDFRSNRSKRRRTTGFDDRVAKKKHRKKQKTGLNCSKDSVVLNKKVPRRVRRRNELKNNPESGFITSGDGTKRLRTHVWHAKRFEMTKMWGFHLPLGLHGRGMGSRALLKKLRDGVLVHDASYYGAVQLEGSQDSLVHMLATVFVPCQSSQSAETNVLSGVTHGTAMLHNYMLPFSPAIAPVIYMWQPLRETNPRKLWVWIHASAFNEGYDALKAACQKEMDEAGVSINCISLLGKLVKLEVMGSKALELLQKILHPVTSDDENSWHLKKCSDNDPEMNAHAIKLSISENISSSAIISLTVDDPRILPEKRVEINLEKTPISKETHVEEHDDKSTELLSPSLSKIEDDCVSKNFDLWEADKGILPPRILPEKRVEINLEKTPISKETHVEEHDDKSTELLSPSLSKIEDDCVSKNFDLWEADKGILPPVEENILCMEKGQQRLAFYQLGNTNSCRASTVGLSCRSCPIMLLNGNENKGSISRWSIVLPLSWVKPFWGCLVSRGAHAIGIREKQWVASEGKLPCFPSDFPDCNSYSCYMATKSAASEETRKLRPLAMRPFSIPMPPPWESIQNSINIETITSKDAINDNRAFGHCGSSFHLSVARTSKAFAEFLGDIHGEHLLLFPHLLDTQNNIAKFMKNDERLRERLTKVATIINCGQRLCFLRVIIEAYRGGVFEEGAVVCAPHYSDIIKYRTDGNKEEIQIPDSSVRSYFQQKPSGKWELEIPVDPIAKASHRWPIGFITSGFVRGSKKPSAIALCETTLLARLREEQWKETNIKSRRKEIYLLVRNLRSTTYKLALATIVLELEENDLAFE